MKKIFLGLGDMGATRTPGQELRTLALGSCVALIMMDPKARCIAMVHVVLPESSIDPARSQKKPGHFADTAVPALLGEMKKLGSDNVGKGMIIKLVGGANVMDPNNTFNIGKRNALAIKKALWKFGMGPRAEDIGGRISRSVSVDVDTGKVKITSPGRDGWEL
ncbi:chemotaxis protein CheD [Desulfatibacillum alkenivorans]|jgi:chemotaxis protein CheD|nr:chemotaxis protein CheD [Desulfatibacillum alkenivorans]